MYAAPPLRAAQRVAAACASPPPVDTTGRYVGAYEPMTCNSPVLYPKRVHALSATGVIMDTAKHRPALRSTRAGDDEPSTFR